uniref:Sacsin/Nov domain-containing protein n=1 Tax=Fagus sylvatica TaxID=28930 RepID=A0A2N9J2L5_FAGSY
MEAAREHIEEIRKTKFSIGGQQNPLTEDLHQAVKNLSAELYAKDVHFLMELIQNAEDNDYLEGVNPSLEFVITSEDITATGAPATLLIFNNEKGFSSKNIDSICSVGRSTKKGNRKRGYIGEKGIGFKSVFLVSAQPYIFSNGYQIQFNEEPCPDCNLGYIVPKWVEENPTLSDIKEIYGSGTTLPTTTIVLPLKLDKVKPVKQQLSAVHPEVLLFLTKIKRLSVREHNKDPRLNTVSAIAITSETNFEVRKNIDAVSYTLHLSADEKGKGSDRECSYYMWKQRFPVRHENKVEKRMEVEEWVITLAFPYAERLHRGMSSSPGIYAFLPTEMFTNFPFIIQADFLLSSSRESILLDNKWNQGILDCVPTAFINAFLSLVKTSENAPVSSLAPMFRFIPINSSSYPELNIVRESIKAKLLEESILPSESYTQQKIFHQPREVGRLMPAFWTILEKARKQEVSLVHLSSHGKYILSSSFDQTEYDHILNFLGVELVNNEWYAKCIQSSKLVEGVSEDLYLELLLFIADNWKSKFYHTNIKNIPLIKYVGLYGDVSLCSINESMLSNRDKVVSLSRQYEHISWLIDWNKEFKCPANYFFLPKSTQESIQFMYKRETVLGWLQDHVKVGSMNVYEYAVHLNNCLTSCQKRAIAFVHFLYHSLRKKYLAQGDVGYLCGSMPLVDNYGDLKRQRNGVLVPANGSKWVGLIGSNPWRGEGYVQLAEDYLQPGYFAGEYSSKVVLLEFLKTHVGASDIPDISPPNASIPTVSSLLTKQNAFLLLGWIRNLKQRGIHIPVKFLRCIKEGSWLKITTCGCPGNRPPSQSFMLSSLLGNILQNGSVLVDIPLVDLSFYGDKMNEYKEELKTIGVMSEFGEACEFIGERLMSLTEYSTLTREQVFSVLNFIRFLRQKILPLDKFINSIKEKKWLRTCCGDRSPVGSVLYDQEWRTASQISNIPFIDQEYFGEEILSFRVELKSLGVVIGFGESYQLVVDNLKSPSRLTSLTASTVLLILECMRRRVSSNKLVEALRGVKGFKTNLGYKSPGECFLYDSQWVCILQVFKDFPLIDHKFYGTSIFTYRNELKQTGVKVDFEDAVKEFSNRFKQQASYMTKENVLSFLLCCRQLKNTHVFPPDLKNYIREGKWLQTRHGRKRPSECILFGPDWQSICPITDLPFIDGDNCYGKDIHEYKKELKSMGVVVEFKDGAKFVAAGLLSPLDPTCITPANVFSLLECIRILLKDKNYSFPDAFFKNISQKWLKTTNGYRPPHECLLFDSNENPSWGSYLKRTDGPFIDEDFYGSNITLYKKELQEIGVTIDFKEGCSLIASHLDAKKELKAIVRVYNYLSQFNWEPDVKLAKWIWIPNGKQDGKWVSPSKCVLHDKDGLFSSELKVLEKYYEQKLLNFFSRAFGVRCNPSVDHYSKLWEGWQSSGYRLSHDDCRKFWGYVLKHWSEKTEKTLTDKLVKLPVASGSDEILLFSKDDVFIADDLQLKDLFEQFSPQPIFVWYPQPSLPSLPQTKLLEIYRKIGVRTISESVEKEESSSVDVAQLNEVNPKEFLIKKDLVTLILGFLADPVMKMEAERRHETIQRLLNDTFIETVEPITVNYSLSLSSGEIVKATASRMIRWDREASKFFTQKLDRSSGFKNLIEYATYFSEAISEGVLWENNDHIGALTELIKLAFMLEFNEEAVLFLMKSKNLQIFLEDKEFLASAFPSD